MNKVTEEMKQTMIELKAKGFSTRKIAKILMVSQATVCYHTDEKQVQKKRDRKEYNKNYQSDRYNNDPEFRERAKKANRDNQKRKREKHGKK